MKKITNGIVLEIISLDKYLILTEDYGKVECILSRKSKLYLEFDIQLGEEVQLEISPVNNASGRIEPRGWKRSIISSNLEC